MDGITYVRGTMKEITYPITVNQIEFGDAPGFRPGRYRRKQCGQLVMVRPIAEEYGNKTFLGVLLGELAVSQACSFDEATGLLKVDRCMFNPMIFIPEKNAVVFGYESWWGVIKSEDQLRQITDADIQSVWYVKALKQIGEEIAKAEADEKA